MRNLLAFLFLTMLVVSTRAYDWHDEGNLVWAPDCDFFGNDLSNAQIPGEQCGPRCSTTGGCTHFTWTDHNGGTCWMKQGSVSQDQAQPKGGAVCGTMKNNPPPPPPSGN